MSAAPSESCGGEANALLVCAFSPTGSLCFGDSGSALTPAGTPTTSAIGVTDVFYLVEGKSCKAGALGGFANLAAGEIRDFVEGAKRRRVRHGAERGSSSAACPWPGAS